MLTSRELLQKIILGDISLSQGLMFSRVLFKDYLSKESHQWICNELDSYDSIKSLPDYRIINCSIKAIVRGYYVGTRIEDVDTSSIDRIMRERGNPTASPNKMLIRQGVESIEQSLGEIGSYVQMQLLQEQVDLLTKFISIPSGWRIEKMFQECSGEYIKAIIPSVRNRLITIIQNEVIQRSKIIDKSGEIVRKKVFISYGWDDVPHREWVKSLADRLSEFFDVMIDEQIPYGSDLNSFMEQMISTSDRVLLILTPKYKEKADARLNGVGYESILISGELYRNQGTAKFLPIIRKGSVPDSYPLYLGTRKGLDMSEDKDFEATFAKLVDDIKQYS